MPADGPTIRGNPGPHIVRNGLVFNPETGIYHSEIEYAGTKKGISGLALSFRDRNQEHRLDYESGVSSVVVSIPTQGAPILDKYEIQWEMEQRSIWSHPAVKDAAMSYDSGLADGESTFRKLAESAVDGPMDVDALTDPISGAIFQQVVAHLRAGIDGWEQEYVSLRRTRIVPPNLGVGCNIQAASLIYTTEQLQLPGDVLFSVPSDSDIAGFDEPDPTNFKWGWRRRPSTSMIQGQTNEQTSQFLLASWSLMLYEPATSNADW